jgi:predicted DNA-binding transcriptional regulator AlpA
MTTQNTINKTHDATVDGASDGLLNKRGLAAKLGISKRTVDAYMRKKWLPYIKLGKTVRFRWGDVVESLNRYRVN